MKLLDFALKTRCRPMLGYGIALLSFLIAFLFHWAASERGSSFVTFVPAVMVATLLGGRWPGILNAVFCGLAAWYFFLPPIHTFSLVWPASYVAMTLYAITVALIVNVVETMFSALNAYRAEKAVTATMFHELQHRIANNLQFIASMLSIQRRKIAKDPSTAEALLDEASQRLATMARIHRRLYDPAASGMEFGALVQELSHELISAVGASNVVCVVDMPPIKWNPDRLITLALLVTEIITNSLKHAFPGGKGGAITIHLIQATPHRMELTIADNGRGLPDDFNISSGKSLGMQIIQGLVAQIGGTMEISSEGGTKTRIMLPV